jgi:hypothetical protein
MATRSNIGIVNLDKSITGIYCHWDGYPEYVGKMLLNHYNNDDIVNGLMDLGNLSILSESLHSTTGINLYSTNNRHTFNNPQDGVCVAYGRDRGDTGSDSRTFEDLGEYENFGSGVDYQYLFEDGKWMYRNTYEGGWSDLTPEICK